ncbi:MAG TPA: cellulase family glycosylhydrolase [Stellaceae bacterium]
MITTIAGTGQSGFAGDGGAATEARLSFPIRAVAAPDGGILIADEANDVIREVHPDGSITTVAGTAGAGSFGGDGGPATKARLNGPTGVNPLPDGGFLIADRSNNRIRQVSSSGIITTVAGSGRVCPNPAAACGDGGPATAAMLNAPNRVVPMPGGGFLTTEDRGNKVRMVSASGVITRVAGTGVACSVPRAACGDGGLATAARLNAPNGIDLVPGGGFVISDSNDNRIREVSAKGVITTIAGNGVAGSFGDGISAKLANLNAPSSVAVAPNGAIVIADTFSHLVRIVSGGTIRTLAGTADTLCPTSTAKCGDGGPGKAAKLNTPYDVSVTPDGMVLVADHLDQRIRRIAAFLGGPPTLSVQNHRLVNGAGEAVQLRGVNRAIFESRCTYDTTGVADGPANQASVDAMLAWKIDVVRVTLNEDCWLGINGFPLGGNVAGYRSAVVGYVGLLRRNGLYVVLDPESSAPGRHQSTEIDYMPDNDHMPAFWRSVAARFKSDHGIVFDPITEVGMASWNNPHPTPPGQWNCWLNGCTLDSVYGGRFRAAGLQSLVTAIRSQGATQPIVLGGLDFNADLSQLLAHLPSDSEHQLVASAHVYDFAEGSGINAMFKNQLVPIAKELPVILGELGERNCDAGTAAYTQHVLSLVNGQAAAGTLFGVIGWTWNARTRISAGWRCPTGPNGEGGPLLIRNYTGTPTVMGGVLRSWIQSRAASP